MATPPMVFIICSDQARNGKTLLARALVDFLLMEGRDPFCFDLGHPEAALRAYFPGRTALVDFTMAEGQARVFDTILTRAGRDYVIDLPASRLARFCEAAGGEGFPARAREKDFRLAALFIVDRDEKSLATAAAVEEILLPDIFVPVANRFVGSALPDGVPGPVLAMEGLGDELRTVISHRRFSFRAFMQGDEAAVPARHRHSLKSFLHGLVTGMREFEPALSLQALRETSP
jgi:hypothetical protein